MDHHYLTAFRDLSTNRPIGDNFVGPIPHRDVAWYGAERWGLAGEDLRAFEHVIREMDAEFREHERQEMERRRAEAERKGARDNQTGNARRRMTKGGRRG